MTIRQGTETVGGVSAQRRGFLDWPRWAPYVAVAWSLLYGALGVYWALSGHGFPFMSEAGTNILGPLLGRFGMGAAWMVVVMAGIPAAVLGAAMLRVLQEKALRPLLITLGGMLALVLLLLMTDLNLLILLGYIPFTLFRLFAGADIRYYLEELIRWPVIHQLLCLIGGFLWLASTVAYARRSGGSCLYCGRKDAPAAWQRPDRAARWGRIAVYVSMVAPVSYAFTRYAWALGIPLGMSEEYFRLGQERGTWISGLFLATFGLVGAVLTLGLVQRWGVVFPRWMIGLAGRRVPITLAVVPASLVSVLLVVGGIVIWSGLAQMTAALAAGRSMSIGILWEIMVQVGPTLLFPAWGAALAVAALGYYLRRRGPCRICGRGE